MAISFLEQRILLKTGDFRERVIQAILTAALAIKNEDPGTPNHASRVQLVHAVVMNPAGMEQRFSEIMATQMTSMDPADADISNAVSAIWNLIALVMFPA